MFLNRNKLVPSHTHFIMDISCFCIHTLQKYLSWGRIFNCLPVPARFSASFGHGSRYLVVFPNVSVAGWAVPKVQQIDWLLQKFLEECQPVIQPSFVIQPEVYFAVSLQGYRIILGTKNKSDNPCSPEGSCCQEWLQATPNVTPKETTRLWRAEVAAASISVAFFLIRLLPKFHVQKSL